MLAAHRSARSIGIAVSLMALSVGSVEAQVLGAAPTYTNRTLSDVPNAAAITARIWVPGLDDGYVPQGLTAVGKALFLSSYHSVQSSQDRGPCRLYRVEPGTGAVTGVLDLPPTCGHAGGLAKGPPGRLFVADTRVVFEVELGSSGDHSIGRVIRSFRLAGHVKGSFAAGTADALWLGTYDKSPGARLYKFLYSNLKQELTEQDAVSSVAMPREAQGASFGADGRLWISRSGGRFGELQRLDPATGSVEAVFAMPAGLEDLTFDASGQLWALSEAGSRRWLGWDTFFPVMFRIDPQRLR